MKQKILAEIERLINDLGEQRDINLEDLRDFINSLPEEPVSEDLEEAAKEHAVERFRTTRDEFLAEKCKWSFKAGAQWQKQQMMKDLLVGYVCLNQTAHNEELPDHCIITNEEPKEIFDKRGLKEGDLVKIIIIKED